MALSHTLKKVKLNQLLRPVKYATATLLVSVTTFLH